MRYRGQAPCYTELVSATNQLKWSTALEAKIDQTLSEIQKLLGVTID